MLQVLYENISVPVIIAVVIAIVLVILLLILAKICYSRHHTQRKRVWKAPPTPPTPRLTQYELPGQSEAGASLNGMGTLRYVFQTSPKLICLSQKNRFLKSHLQSA